jgi:hypothetical protein
MSNEYTIEIITAILRPDAAKKWNRICEKYFPNTSNEFDTIITLMDEIIKSNPEIENRLLRKALESSNPFINTNQNDENEE